MGTGQAPGGTPCCGITEALEQEGRGLCLVLQQYIVSFQL